MSKRVARPGVSMLQTIISVSMAAVLLVINAGWIHQTLKISSIVKRRQRHQQNLARLATQFRRDVWQSESAKLKDENQLVLQGPQGQETVYTISETTILIEKSLLQVDVAGAPDASAITALETYRVDARASVKVDDTELPKWVTLTVTRGVEGVSMSPDDLEKFVGDDQPRPIDLRVRVAPGRWLAEPIGIPGSEGKH